MKTINKMMTNGEIYAYAVGMANNFPADNDNYLPAAIAYSLQKNKSTLISISEEIEKGRFDILSHYAIGERDGQFQIDPGSIDVANQELNDLLSIEQEVKIYSCKIEELGDIKFTSAQMESMMFMIYED